MMLLKMKYTSRLANWNELDSMLRIMNHWVKKFYQSKYWFTVTSM